MGKIAEEQIVAIMDLEGGGCWTLAEEGVGLTEREGTSSFCIFWMLGTSLHAFAPAGLGFVLLHHGLGYGHSRYTLSVGERHLNMVQHRPHEAAGATGMGERGYVRTAIQYSLLHVRERVACTMVYTCKVARSCLGAWYHRACRF